MQIGMGFYRWAQQYGWSEWPQHLDAVLGAAAQGGYAGLEGFLDIINMDTENRWRTALAQYGISLAGLYTTAPLHDATTQDQTIETILLCARVARGLGATFVDANPLPIEARKTDRELALEVAGFQRLGRRLSEEGLSLVVHQHLPELRDNARELRAILDKTGPEVGLCLDVDWLHRGGQDVAQWIADYGRRIGLVHLRTARGGVWNEILEDGEPDLPGIAQALKAVDYDGWLTVELAWEEGTPVTLPLAEAHARSRAYVRDIFGV